MFCEDAGIPKDACLKCRLVLEELFLNTVKHGHKGGSDAPIWIRLSAVGARVSLTYEDRAPPFNPFPSDREGIVKAIEQNRTEGGLGVILMHDLAESAQYSYLFGRNRIQLTIG
jgi:anti-sigma regulatory factor (Ser/Thr protein kinase)